MLGKWHLGFCKADCLPTNRGFDSYYGCWTGAQTYWTHIAGSNGYDWRDYETTDKAANGTYMSDLVGERGVQLVEESGDDPLFMYVAFINPHTPIEAPQNYIDMYPEDMAPLRRTYLGMVTAMDNAIGQIVDAFKAAGKYDDTIFIFSSDNGGDSTGANSNGHLQGFKGSLYEGGSRVAMMAKGPGIQSGAVLETGIFHLMDWVPTLMNMIGEPIDESEVIDGIDNSAMFTEGAASNRDEYVYNIDLEPVAFFGQAAIRKGDWKLIWGNEGFGLGSGFNAYGITNYPPHVEYFRSLPPRTGGGGAPPRHKRGGGRMSAEGVQIMMSILARDNFNEHSLDVNTGATRLFNLAEDPSELNDVSGDNPEIVLQMQNRLVDLIEEGYVKPDAYRSESVPSAFPSDDNEWTWDTGFCEDVSMDNLPPAEVVPDNFSA